MDNLTPRGLILNLGHDCWACFDTDLIRMSAIWEGQGVSPVSMSQISYHSAGTKCKDGQSDLPKLVGTPWLANGIYPGWQAGEQFSLSDPRAPGPDANEIGRGSLPATAGRFQALRLTEGAVCLEYDVAGLPVREWVEARLENGERVVQRHFRLERVPHSLWLLVGQRPSQATPRIALSLEVDNPNERRAAELMERADGLFVAHVRPEQQPVEFRVVIGLGREGKPWPSPREAGAPPVARWPETLTTRGTLSSATDAYVVDNIPLPLQNPWRRNIRLADLAFFRDGRAAAVTFDGDVWMISGLSGDLASVRWRRFASGLHEPQSLCIRDEEIFVFDRNGIWRLRDVDGNGEADVHELFSNAFAQTAETREYAQAMKLAPDGAFIIGKGGIQMSTLGRHNGSVLRISPDGKSAQVIGWGLRSPYLGVHPKTGLITASDQQGHYVPTTPLHIIRDHQFYGFLSSLLPKENYPAPITEPLTWIPYSINASGANQAWLVGAQMGPLNEAMIHFGYYRSEIFVVLLNERAARPQAAVVSVTRDLEFPPFDGAVNPIDGQLYFTGFQIFGTTARQISGLARLRYTGAPSPLPRELVAMDKGVLLRFDVALDELRAGERANFSAERWNYKRTANYGSPHFKLDGSPGQEAMIPSSAYLSKDGKSVFIGIPDMKPVMQMRLGWSLATREGVRFERNAYFTPHQLVRFDPAQNGFDPLTVDLAPKTAGAAEVAKVSAEEGKRVAEMMGCVACHSTDGTVVGKVGPTWKGLFGSQVLFADSGAAVADEAYLRESIKEPAAKVVRGFEKSEAGMPSYEGVISDAQIEALILYLKTLGASEEEKLGKAVTDFFAAPARQRAGWKFPAGLDKLLQENESAVRRVVWEAFRAAPIHGTLEQDHAAHQVRFENYLSPYTVKTVGTRPTNGWALFIALHGGGGAPKEVNDSQWKQMQSYYREHPEAGGYLYVALRAPNDTWNGFYDTYVYPLVANLTRQFRLFGDVNANKVFILGYSHGGYGAFAIGPKMPDHFAAIHASAAAPTDGETTARTLRNTPFTCMVGEKDTMYGRYDRDKKFADLVEKLRGDRTDIYPVRVDIIAGNGHTGLPDRDKVKEMYPAVRQPAPRELTWLQTDKVIRDFFWLHTDAPGKQREIEARCQDNQVTVTTSTNVISATVLLDGRLIDFGRPVTLIVNGVRSSHPLRPSLRVLCETLLRRGDPDLAFTAQLELPLANGSDAPNPSSPPKK